MTKKTTLTFALMDAPFESARSMTALRLIEIAARRGYDINVFAYEGAVFLPFAKQQQHANAVHGRSLEEENHVLPRLLIASLMEEAAKAGGRIDWVNCGLCVDERGAGEAIEGVRRGSPADFWKMAEASDNTLVIGTRG
jgi:sulfur relay (sulfurtransferase) complex TusBCD TusD component (DsrE family)